MTTDRWRMGFHIMPSTGWLNDPNGLCQFHGIYHVFHQYSPDWPAPGAPRGWGHATSRDLIHWEHHGMAIRPDTPDEAQGSYSGCAVRVGTGADEHLRFYYTGNVKEPGDFDYIHTGRRAAQLLIESPDGFELGEKRVLLRNEDYPANCTLHVRDPKVWVDADGTWWMLLGARDVDDCGMVLVLSSADGIAWTVVREIYPCAPFGFMWECPDRIELDGHVYLSCCPQGMAAFPWASGMRDVAGYFPLPEGADLSTFDQAIPAESFRLWDHGFDFYAPQTFTDEQGRTLLIGWMGMPEAPYESAPDNLSWCHCLTVPRVLTRQADGVIAQAPAPELDGLHEQEEALVANDTSVLSGHRHDLVIEGIDDPFSLTLDDELEIVFEDGSLTLRFTARGTASIGAGRTERSCAVENLSDVRVLVDSSAVEVFANGGRIVFATRWFPCADTCIVRLVGSTPSARAWRMGDGMRGTYA